MLLLQMSFVQITEAKQQLLMSCLIIIEAAFIHRHGDDVGQLEQLDETFHCAFSAVAGFLTSLQPQMVYQPCFVFCYIFYFRYLCLCFFDVKNLPDFCCHFMLPNSGERVLPCRMYTGM